MAAEPVTPAKLDPREVSARKRRNIWLGLALFAFVILMGVGTAIRIGQGAGTNPCEASLYWDMRSNECLELPDSPGPVDQEAN